MSAGHIRNRSPGSWELRYRANGKTCTETVRGGKKVAERRLRELLTAVDKGQHVSKSAVTIGDFTRERIAVWQVSPLTREHYEQLGRLVTAHLGAIPLQRLTTIDVERWHAAAGVAPSTLRHAHGLLVRMLSDAVRHKLVSANVAREQPPPKATANRVRVPTEDLIAPMLEALRGTEFHTPAVVAVFCGLRRGEMLALRWCDLDLDRASMTIARALEETRAGGISIKSTKTEAGERTITLPAKALEALREHRRQQLELRMALGQGRPDPDALVFPNPVTGQAQPPRAFSLRWLRTVRRLGLPPCTWHSLRHLHCSLLLRHGVDITTVSRRLGHSRVDTTARLYAHAIARDDRHAAEALDRALGG